MRRCVKTVFVAVAPSDSAGDVASSIPAAFSASSPEPGYAVLSSRSRAGCVRHSLDPATSLQTANANGRLGERVAELQPRTFTGIVLQLYDDRLSLLLHSVESQRCADLQRRRPDCKI